MRNIKLLSIVEIKGIILAVNLLMCAGCTTVNNYDTSNICS